MDFLPPPHLIQNQEQINLDLEENSDEPPFLDWDSVLMHGLGKSVRKPQPQQLFLLEAIQGYYVTEEFDGVGGQIRLPFNSQENLSNHFISREGSNDGHRVIHLTNTIRQIKDRKIKFPFPEQQLTKTGSLSPVHEYSVAPFIFNMNPSNHFLDSETVGDKLDKVADFESSSHGFISAQFAKWAASAICLPPFHSEVPLLDGSSKVDDVIPALGNKRRDQSSVTHIRRMDDIQCKENPSVEIDLVGFNRMNGGDDSLDIVHTVLEERDKLSKKKTRKPFRFEVNANEIHGATKSKRNLGMKYAHPIKRRARKRGLVVERKASVLTFSEATKSRRTNSDDSVSKIMHGLLQDQLKLEELVKQEKMKTFDQDVVRLPAQSVQLVAWKRFHSNYQAGRIRLCISSCKTGRITLVTQPSSEMVDDIRDKPNLPILVKELLNPFIPPEKVSCYLVLFWDGTQWELVGSVCNATSALPQVNNLIEKPLSEPCQESSELNNLGSRRVGLSPGSSSKTASLLFPNPVLRVKRPELPDLTVQRSPIKKKRVHFQLPKENENTDLNTVQLSDDKADRRANLNRSHRVNLNSNTLLPNPPTVPSSSLSIGIHSVRGWIQ